MLDGDVQRFGPSVQAGVLQTDVTDGGRVYQRHEVANIVHQEAVEQIGVLVLQAGKVEVLVDARLASLNHLHRSCALSLQAFHRVREETGEVLGNTLFRGE